MQKSGFYRGLAKIKARQSQFQEAYDFIQKAINTAPDIGVNYLWLGNYPSINLDERVAALWKAVDIANETSDKKLQVQALIGLGNSSAANKKNEEARKHYQSAIDLAPSNNLLTVATKGKMRCESFLKPTVRLPFKEGRLYG